jgi:hypothetical protein
VMTTFAAKPATRTTRVSPLKQLNDLA